MSSKKPIKAFYTLSDPAPEDYNCPVGTEYDSEYIIDISSGREELKLVGKTNRYNKIQSYTDECDIYNLINRYNNGDDTVLMQRAAQYADVTTAPKNLHEALAIVSKAKHDFDRLPVAVKQQYNNNYMEFLGDFGTEKFMAVFAKSSEDPKEPPVEKEAKT